MSDIIDADDRAEIRRALELLAGPTWQAGHVVELRALDTPKGIVSGYFDREHLDDMVEAAWEWSGAEGEVKGEPRKTLGVYLTFNAVKRDCLARAANRVKTYAKHTTKASNIAQRCWLLIDCDPIKAVEHVSATVEEKERALAAAITVRDWLAERGWPAPIYADTGNGGALYFRIDLPADDGGLVSRVLQGVKAAHPGIAADIDTSVCNADRLCKVPGTLAAKGDHTTERPHRLARLIDVPESLEIVTREKLEALGSASIQPATEGLTNTSPDESSSKSAFFQQVASQRPAGAQIDPDEPNLDLKAYLVKHKLCRPDVEPKPWDKGGGKGLLYELERCPWDEHAKSKKAYVIQFDNGKLAASCQSADCKKQKPSWAKLRDITEPGWRERKRKKKGPNHREIVLREASGDDLFHSPAGETFATVKRNGHTETWPVGKSYESLLRSRLFARKFVPSRTAMGEALASLDSKAKFDGPERSVFVRVAEHAGKHYLDLCNDAWEAVEIDGDGWRIVANPPVRFIRKPGMLALPMPTREGEVSLLRELLNVTNDDWTFVLAWLMGALQPTGPYPILLVGGSHGSAKSTACRLLRSLVDPNSVPLCDMPKDSQGLMIQAQNSHVALFDNLSNISRDMSNALCRLATGGGHRERANYTDDGEKLFFSTRPILLNGIGISDFLTRPDLLSRALPITLPAVAKRRTQKEIDKRFAEIQPAVLGALLTATSFTMSQLAEVDQMQGELPRLADFGQTVAAAEPALGLSQGEFLRRLSGSEMASHAAAVEASPIALSVRKLAERGDWNGSAAELLDALGDGGRNKDWPATPRALSHQLREMQAALKGTGIVVEFVDSARPKRIEIRQSKPSVELLPSIYDAMPKLLEAGYDSRTAFEIVAGLAKLGAITGPCMVEGRAILTFANPPTAEHLANVQAGYRNHFA